MSRHDLLPIPSRRSEITLTEKPQKRHTGGSETLILTLSGATKFNFRKHIEQKGFRTELETKLKKVFFRH